jgi:hypothetical protein
MLYIVVGLTTDKKSFHRASVLRLDVSGSRYIWISVNGLTQKLTLMALVTGMTLVTLQPWGLGTLRKFSPLVVP